MIPFGQWLKATRKACGLSQRALADAIGCNHTYLSKIEAGKLPPPGPETLEKIATTLHTDIDRVYRLARRVPAWIVEAFACGMEDVDYGQFAALKPEEKL